MAANEEINGNGIDVKTHKTSNGFVVPTLIRNKRNGQAHTEDEIKWWIEEVCKKDGAVQDSQIGAWLMAVFHNDLSPDETTWLTDAMLHSGDILQWPAEWRGQLMDKHSTGGVGDKVSLPLAPALAACGAKVPMISGRGLGHTGGTLDKLESLPGYNVSLHQSKMTEILAKVGCFIVGQTENLVPADGKLYGIRDVTATVDCIPLITSSIMSKKAAEMVGTLILDVKCGKAAFMNSLEKSRELATSLVLTGEALGINMIALITDMNDPIGFTIGNSLEVAEALQCLKGKGVPDLVQLVANLGGHLLHSAGHVNTPEAGIHKIKTKLEDGSALQKFHQMIVEQGVEETIAQKLMALDMTQIDDIWKVLRRAETTTDLSFPEEGYVESINAMTLALVAGELGAGRFVAGAPINHAVGLRLMVSVGTHLMPGETWIRVYSDGALSEEHMTRLRAAVKLSKSEVGMTSRILDVIKKA